MLGLAAILAAITCRDYAGSWNDGSRLATVECLVDHGTFAIDHSIFTNPRAYPAAYSHAPLRLQQTGTLDKLFIRGHYYSDKSPVPAVLMAGGYWCLQKATGLKASDDPARFCLIMTLMTSGVAYTIAVWCIYLLGRKLKVPLGPRLMVTASFALATIAPVYLQHTNNHILLLGVAAPLMLMMLRFSEHLRRQKPIRGSLLALGMLTGLGYTIDLGIGPVLVLTTGLYVIWKCHAIRPVMLFGGVVLSWMLLHHILNYAVGGTILPANMVKDYFQWEGSPFSSENLTGALKHANWTSGSLYLFGMLLNKQGFLMSNLPLFLVPFGLLILFRQRIRERAEVLFALTWTVGSWVLYGATSNNHSGLCCSIRWFVPLLAPLFFIILLIVREAPITRPMLAVLSLSGFYLTMCMSVQGPWSNKLVPGNWYVQGVALLTCGWIAIRSRMAEKRESKELPRSRTAHSQSRQMAQSISTEAL